MQPHRPLTALIVFACFLAGSVGAWAQSQTPPTEPAPPNPPEQTPQPEPEPKLVARELVVLRIDTYGQRANDPIQVRTTLTKPIDHIGRRKLELDRGGYANTPMPLGLISFQGRVEAPLKVRVDLTGDAAKLHAHWPSDAQTTPKMVQWPVVREADEQLRPYPIGGGGHWLEDLRASEDRLWLVGRENVRQQIQAKERFLLYDASFVYQPAISLALDDKVYRVKTTLPAEQTPPLTLLIHREPTGWAASTLTGPWEKPDSPLDSKPEDLNSYSPLLKPVLKPLAELLAQRGYSAQEIEIAQAMVQSAGLEASTMSLMYVLPEGVIDQHIQLRIQPKPDRVIRTAIIVLTNVDPDLGSRVKRLIADLGSDQWIKRDRAQQTLDAMGQAAIKQLQEQRTDSDPEIAFRAQQLLDTYDLKTEQDR